MREPRFRRAWCSIWTLIIVVAVLASCDAGGGASEVSGRRATEDSAPVDVIESAEPTPTRDQTPPEIVIVSGRASDVAPVRAFAPEIRSVLQDTTYRPGWLIWIDWSGTIVGLDLDPDRDQAFAFETGITNLDRSVITPSGVILRDASRPETELFVDWSGKAHQATSWLVDSAGVVIARNGGVMENVATGETVAVDPASVPPGNLSDRGPYIESKGETFDWTWERGLERVGPGGVATWSSVPKPGVVLRDGCEPDEAPCPLAAFSPGDRSRLGRGSVEAPDHEAGGYAMAPDRHGAAARGQTGWELISVDGDRTVLAQPSPAWWVSTSTAHWGVNSELLAVVGEEVALFDGFDGSTVGTLPVPGAFAQLAFVDLDPTLPMPSPSSGAEADRAAPVVVPTPDPVETSVSFLEEEPEAVADTFRTVGVQDGWVVARLGQEFIAIDLASGASKTTSLLRPTAPYVVTSFGVATLDESDRLVLVGWDESDGANATSIALSDALPRGEGAESLAVHRDAEGTEMTVLTSATQTVALTLGSEPEVKTLRANPMIGDWPFTGDTGPGPLMMPFAGRPKAYSWDNGWVTTKYDRVLLSGVRYFVAESCPVVPSDCQRQLGDRENLDAPRDIDADLDPVAVSPDESTMVFRKSGTTHEAAIIDTATGAIRNEFAITDEIVAMFRDDLVLTLGETYTLYSVQAQQPVLKSRTGSMVAVLDELASLEEFSGEFFPERGR